MSTVLATIRWLSIFTGALSLFYLVHSSFDVGLSEVFHRVYAWYAGILHPVVELLRPTAQWIVGLFGWSLPVWWNEAVVLYFAMGGAAGRSGQFKTWLYKLRLKETGVVEMQEEFALHTRQDMILMPIRLVAWPLFWAIDVYQVLFGPLFLDTQRIVNGYIGASLVEFTKISIGALIFGGLNAGLG